MMHAQTDKPEDGMEILIAEYVCGLLKPEEHAQLHVLLSRDDQALAQALAWEEDLLALVDALPPVPPQAALRERLQRTLGIAPPAAHPPAPLLRRPSREPGAQPEAALEPMTQVQAEPEPVPEASAAVAEVLPVAAPETAEASSAAPIPATYGDGHHQAAGLLADTAEREPPPAAATPPVSKTRTQAERPVRTAPATEATQAPPDPAPTTADPHLVRSLGRKLWLWRLIGICATGAAIAGFMRPSEPPPPPVQIIKVAPTRAAILQAPGTSSTPGWTATLGPEGNLMMQPLVHTEVPVGSQALLWTRSERIPEPRLLGRIDPNQPVQVPAAQLGVLADDQLLEITLETDEDAVQGQPNGPILFIGRMTVFGSEGAASPTADNATRPEVRTGSQ